MKGVVINIQRYSIGDGPGIRSTVFLKGCPLRCLWCSNPESQNPRPETGYRSNLCIHCGKCIQNCPKNAVSADETSNMIHIDRQKCVSCGKCASGCPSTALTMYGTVREAEDVINVVKRDIKYYNNTGGGMTLSGGEPLMQADFSLELLKLAKANGINTCIETTGFGDIGRLLPYLDHVFMDIKAGSSETYRKLTGVGNERILKSLAEVSERGKDVMIRYPCIPGYNTAEEEIEGIAQILKNNLLTQIEIMPYHEYGIGKYTATDRPYTVKSGRPSEEELEKICKIFDSYGIRSYINGRDKPRSR